MAEEKRKLDVLKNYRALVVIVLLIAFTAFTVYDVMSDSSIHGLTVRMYNVSRFCTLDPTSSAKVVTLTIKNAVVWSATSLETSLTHVNFTLSADGFEVGMVRGNDASFGLGQSTPYSLTFKNPTIDPRSLPASSHLVLTVTALVSVGIFSSWVTASDSEVVNLAGQTC